MTAVAAGGGAALVVCLSTGLQLAYGVMVGWNVAATTYCVAVWVTSWRLTPELTAEVAVHEDPSRSATDGLLLVAAVASIASVTFALADAASFHGFGRAFRIVAGVASIVCSWFLVHTIFTLKYARLYYLDEDGGIEFNMEQPPAWSDFAYLAFTIGMTFQVSDTDLQTTLLRRLALKHMVLSYLFGAVIVAVAINLLAAHVG
ncbi:MAG TPA: DUF1345 domain-containing protein [Mycobacteriales bacterium]|nr:DUF1345 domain-containing protein [Mycobacteriales bacterium]